MTSYLVMIIAAMAMTAGGFFYGEHTGAAGEIAKQAKLDDAIQKVAEAAQQGAAKAIAANRPKNITNVQEVRREIEEKVVYRECVNTAGVMHGINAALTGERPDAAGGLKLPKADSAK